MRSSTSTCHQDLKNKGFQGEHCQHSQHHANHCWPENATQDDGGEKEQRVTKHLAYSWQLLKRARPVTTATIWNGTRLDPARRPKIQSPRQIKTPNQRLDEMTCPDIGILS